MKQEITPMRQTGYYFVNFGRNSIRIVYTDGEQCQFLGDELVYPIQDIKFISDTPITPEKMAAIEEIIAVDFDGWQPINDIKSILKKHKLI